MDNQQTQMQTEEQTRELNRIIYWSVGALSLIGILGMMVWSDAGIAVYFDRIAAGFASCF